MSRRAVNWSWVVPAGAVMCLAAAAAPVRADEDPRTVPHFLQALRDHGLHDKALEYIELLRTDTALPGNIKDLLDFEQGRTLIDEAAKSSDLALREELLKDARNKLDEFAKAHAQLAQARDALVLMAKLLIERGHLAMLFSDEATDPVKKEAKAAEARAAFTQAHEAYANAIAPLQAALKNYPAYTDEKDPRHAERAALHISLLDATLQKGVADFELAHTFPPGSAERNKVLKEALDQFESLYKNYRTQMVGLAAQMYQAKCYEEQGNVDAAVGIYKQLMEHGDPALRALQRNVGYFYIVALAKRKQYALAADEATRWLATYNHRDEQRSPEGLGVLIELAKNIEAQMADAAPAERPKGARRIIDAANLVVKYASPHKKEALALLKKYKPSAAVRAEEVVRLSYEDAMGQADEAMASHEWERAIALLKAAVRKADTAKNTDRPEPQSSSGLKGKADSTKAIDKANLARYNLAFSFYMNKQYYESDVMAEHLARRYPQGGLSGKVTEIGMQSLADAYNTYTEIDRRSDITRLIDLARYTAETWPDREEGDSARMNLGLIYSGMGQYDKAIETLAGVRTRSPKWVEAQTRIGAAHWAKSRDLERLGNAAAAQTEAQKAVEFLNVSLKARRDAGAAPTDPGLMGTVGDLSVVLTETGKPADALALLAPVVKAQTVKTGAGFARLMEAQLKALITSGQVEPAIASMKELEQAGGAANRAQLYYKLGKLLEKELESLKQKKNTSALSRMHQAYKTFLTTLADSKTGQTYDSLQWAGEGLLTLDADKEAEKVFRRVLAEFTQDPQFVQQPNGRTRLLRTRLKLAAALRGQGKAEKEKFDEANTLVEELLEKNKRYIEPRFEKCNLLEAEAEFNRGSWATALQQWENLAKAMEGVHPRSLLYYDAWYHVASVLYKRKEPVKARQTLMGVMRLSPGVGGPEMKAKYEALIALTK
jgi:cellulose synthase operon protein C